MEAVVQALRLASITAAPAGLSVQAECPASMVLVYKLRGWDYYDSYVVASLAEVDPRGPDLGDPISGSFNNRISIYRGLIMSRYHILNKIPATHFMFLVISYASGVISFNKIYILQI